MAEKLTEFFIDKMDGLKSECIARWQERSVDRWKVEGNMYDMKSLLRVKGRGSMFDEVMLAADWSNIRVIVFVVGGY